MITGVASGTMSSSRVMEIRESVKVCLVKYCMYERGCHLLTNFNKQSERYIGKIKVPTCARFRLASVKSKSDNCTESEPVDDLGPKTSMSKKCVKRGREENQSQHR